VYMLNNLILLSKNLKGINYSYLSNFILTKDNIKNQLQQ
jgi:hypothetical protein